MPLLCLPSPLSLIQRRMHRRRRSGPSTPSTPKFESDPNSTSSSISTTPSPKPLHLFDLPAELIHEILSYLLPTNSRTYHIIRDAVAEGQQHADAYALLHTCHFTRQLALHAPTWPTSWVYTPRPDTLKQRTLSKRLVSEILMQMEEYDWYSVPLPVVLLSPKDASERQADRVEQRRAMEFVRKNGQSDWRDVKRRFLKQLPPGSNTEDDVGVLRMDLQDLAMDLQDLATTEIERKYATHLKPQSMHACFGCKQLRPSRHFQVSQVTTKRSKLRDLQSPPTTPQAIANYNKERQKRRCIHCVISSENTTILYPIRWVEGWEREAVVDATEVAVLGVGFVCQRWTCKRFVKAEIGGVEEDVEKGVQSPEFLRRTCTRCLDYRRPGGEGSVARGHVMS